MAVREHRTNRPIDVDVTLCDEEGVPVQLDGTRIGIHGQVEAGRPLA